MAVVPEMATEMPNSSAATEPFNSASCLPIGGVVRGTAATAEVVLARRGKEIAPIARSTDSLAIRLRRVRGAAPVVIFA